MRPPACRATCSGTGQCLAGNSTIVESFTGVARPRNGGRRHRRALSRLCSRDDGTQVSRRQQMVKMRHIAEIPDLGFAGLPPGLEVMTLADLRGRAADCMSADFMRPQRLTLSPCSGAGYRLHRLRPRTRHMAPTRASLQTPAGSLSCRRASDSRSSPPTRSQPGTHLSGTRSSRTPNARRPQPRRTRSRPNSRARNSHAEPTEPPGPEDRSRHDNAIVVTDP